MLESSNLCELSKFKHEMYPSFPNYERVTDLAIRLAVPDKPIVIEILRDCEEENLRLKVAATILYDRVERLSRLMSRHRVQIESGAERTRGRLVSPTALTNCMTTSIRSFDDPSHVIRHKIDPSQRWK